MSWFAAPLIVLFMVQPGSGSAASGAGLPARLADIRTAVFGSDYPFVSEGSTERGIASVNGIDITEAQREGIFHRTAYAILRGAGWLGQMSAQRTAIATPGG